MRLKTTLLGLAGLAIIASACAQAGTLDDMASFERVYIPALALTNQPQQPEARVAASLRRLVSAWPSFRERFSREGPQLEKAVLAADRSLEQASALLASGRRSEAHDALESVRAAFIDARRQAGTELYVDRLVAFHDAMEEVVKLVSSGAPAAQVAPRLERASALWHEAERPPFHTELFGFDDAKRSDLTKRIAAERALMDALGPALTGDAEEARRLAKEMKESFSRLYVMFGDFSGL